MYLATALIATVALLYIWLQTGTMKCQFVAISGSPCSSCGLSRDIVQYLRLDFSPGLNPYSLRVFIFLVGQIVLRSALGVSSIESKSWITADIVLSVLWAGYALIPMIVVMIKSQTI